jgi:hypothetical protein
LIVDGCSLLSLALFLRGKERQGALMTTTTITTLPCPTTIQGAVGVVAMMVVTYFHLFYGVCSYYAAPRESFKAKAWKERICSRQSLL